ncbi:MAG: phenylalanine--tRNA ligase subunit beta [Deltaproteobacteria bacterium]|nr:phenylalanine--tRNA ligase subunit beta [Deltaproteobacteria bacterium]
MLISLNWLKEFISIDESPDELSGRLTMAGLEVESVRDLAEGFDRLVVGHILRKDPHPDSDHLTLCRVDVGKDEVQIICGAANHRQGDKVVVALPGARLPNGMEIVPAGIRGVESFGMICSEKEMGLSDTSEGVMILPGDAVPGTPAAEILGRNDTVFEIDLTPNRPDCLSHFGVAREIAAWTGNALKEPAAVVEEKGPEISTLIDVNVREPDLCPRYACRVIENVTIAPSPPWMQERLRAVGLRPINNVVDVTNYLLMELGHPLHAFDFDLLKGNRIEVRRAGEGEKIRTLDEVERTLDEGMLLICDGKKPVAVAGVMGGGNSEVGNGTRRVLLEAACFQPASIRRTAKRLGLHSESSHRFERGTDIEGLATALDRAASLIAALAGGRVAKGRIDIYPAPFREGVIPLRAAKVRDLLGISLPAGEIRLILERLQLTVEEGDRETLHVAIPPFRVDLEREIDLIEEIARIYGYNRIPSTRTRATLEPGGTTRNRQLSMRIRRALAAEGFFETIHYSFHNPDDLDRLGLAPDDPLRRFIEIRNPLSRDQSVMRTTLLPALLHNLRRNLKRSRSGLRLFEVGRTFEKSADAPALEKERLAGVAAGAEVLPGWDRQEREVDFFDLKSVLERLFRGLGISSTEWTALETVPFLHPGKSALIRNGETSLGYLGELHPEAMKRFELPQRVLCFDIDLEALFRAASGKIIYRPAIRFPAVERDIALVLPDTVPAGSIDKAIRESAPGLIRDVRLFDLYRGKPIPEGRKSLAFSIRFQAEDRTLTDSEVNDVRDGIVKKLENEFDATLRD